MIVPLAGLGAATETVGDDHSSGPGTVADAEDEPMTSFRETASGWVIDAVGLEVERCMFDWAVSWRFGGFELRVEEQFWLADGDGPARSFDPESEPASLAPALGTLRRRIELLRVSGEGELVVGFGDRLVMTCSPSADFEAWTLTGDGGFRMVCLPGGGVAVWS